MSTQRDDPSFSDPAPAGSGGPALLDPQGAENQRRFLLSLRVLASLSALLSLLALWSVESRQLAHDLQLAADSEARPGDRLALRALIFKDVDAPEGASLALGTTHVRLLDDESRELARVTLRPTELDTLDGSLQLPAALAGHFILEARAHYQDSELICRRTLEVGPRAASARLHGREAGPLQHLSLGAVHAHASTAPLPFLPRVVGGACVPDEVCRLLVWVGEPAALLSVRANASAELVAPALPSGEVSGIVELQVRVRGPDAALTVEARQHGQLAAERALRLPIGLGEVGLSQRESIVPAARLKPSFVLPPGRAFITVDTFVVGRWSDVRVVSAQAGETPLLSAAFASSGLVRVQARADRLSADGSGGRVFYVKSHAETDLDALASSARALAALPELAAEPTAAWSTRLPAFAADDVQRTAAYLLAPLEQLRMSVPLPVSGRPAQLARLSRTRALFRFGVAGALVLSAFVLALSIARRGMVAAEEAQSILDLARAEGENEASEPRPGEVIGARVRVLLLAFAVAAAFLAAALLIAAKPLWF